MKHSDGWRQFVRGNVMPKMEMSAATTLPAAPADAPTSVGLQFMWPGFDPVEILPERSKDLLHKLRLRSADAHAVVPEFESIRQAALAKTTAANAVKRYTDPASAGGFNLNPADGQVVAAQKLFDKAADDLRRLQELSEIRTAAWQAASAALSNVETYLRHGKPANTTFEAVEVEVPKPAKGENGVLDQIETRRRRVRELKADLHRIASAPFPSSYCKSRVRETVEALAQTGAPVLTNVIEHDSTVIWPSKTVQSEVHGAQRSLSFSEQPDALALTCWLHRDALIARLNAEIDSESDDKAALSHADREVRAAEVQADLVEVERVEAALVFDAWSKGLPCEHRADCNALAILSCALVTPRA